MNSKFERYRISGPEKPKSKALAAGPAAKALAAGEGPASVRSGVMIHQMRQGLKKAIKSMRGDLTQFVFARKVGISQAALARMESLNNEVFPTTPLLIRMAVISERDVRISFVERTKSESDPDTISAETAGFAPSLRLGEGVVVRDEYPFDWVRSDTAPPVPEAKKTLQEG